MNLLRVSLLLVLAIGAGCQSPTPVVDDGRITVTFVQPEKFSDARSSNNGPTDQGYLDELKAEINRSARRSLAAGQTLKVTFTDLDMAGEFEPWHSRSQDVRIIKAIYLPRIKFTYVFADAAGRTIREGKEELTDLNFQSRIQINNSEPLFYEKGMMNDWIRQIVRA